MVSFLAVADAHQSRLVLLAQPDGDRNSLIRVFEQEFWPHPNVFGNTAYLKGEPI